MSVSSSRTHLKRRIDDYLWYDDTPPLRDLRRILLNEFVELGEVAIIGGLVRDIARKGASGFRSDVDLVLNVPPATVDALARRLNAVPNRFGGFGIRLPLWKIDFWALRNTWAHKHQHVKVNSIGDLTKTTFFNVDAIAYVINNRKLLAPNDYVDTILSNVLDVNLLPNPSVDGNLVRTVRRVLGGNMILGKELRKFVIRHLDGPMFEHIKTVEMSLYNWSFAESYESADQLLKALLKGRSREPMHSDAARQYLLPF